MQSKIFARLLYMDHILIHPLTPPAKQNFYVDSNYNMIQWNQLINASKASVGKNAR